MYYTFDGILWILKDHRRVTSSNVTFEVINNSPVESFTFVCEDENTYYYDIYSPAFKTTYFMYTYICTYIYVDVCVLGRVNHMHSYISTLPREVNTLRY